MMGLVTLVGWAHHAANHFTPQVVSVWVHDYDVLALELSKQTLAEGREGFLHGAAYWEMVREAAKHVRIEPIDEKLTPDRDTDMADALERLAREGLRVLYLVGYLHLPELKRQLRERGIPYTAIQTADDSSGRITLEGVPVASNAIDLGAVPL